MSDNGQGLGSELQMCSERLICEGLTEARPESLISPRLSIPALPIRLGDVGSLQWGRFQLKIRFLNEVAPALMPI